MADVATANQKRVARQVLRMTDEAMLLFGDCILPRGEPVTVENIKATAKAILRKK